MNATEWEELVALKDAIDGYPQSVAPEHQARFTELFVKSLAGKGDCPPFPSGPECTRLAVGKSNGYP